MKEPADISKYQRGRAERSMSATTCTIYNKLLLKGKLSDLVIKVDSVEFNVYKNALCGCSSYFNAHKDILSGCSSYFQTLFTSRWNNAEQRVYSIPGVSPHMMCLIMEYAYTRSVTVTAKNVEELLSVADQLCIMGVVRACCNFLEGQLCPENCIGVWKFADFYNCPDLKRKAFLFILHHFEEMVHVSKEFPELSLQQLVHITEQDKLNVKQEDAVFEAILLWIAHSSEDRKAHISVLLPKVRMGLMTAGYFMNRVKTHELVKDNSDCKPIIINALKAMNGPSNAGFHNPLARPRLPYGILLAIGGWSGGGPINGTEVYDARVDRWVNGTINEESPRSHHGAAFLNGFVYCVGGSDGVDYSNSVSKFNLVTRTWHQVAPMHSRRCYISVAVLNGCIYAMGGFDGHVRLNTVERYDPETNQWTLIAPMRDQRSDASATTLHGKVYICGGFTGKEYLSTAECYSPETNQWTLIEPMRSRRSGVRVIAYREHVYAMGGFGGGSYCLRSAEAYSPLTNTWRAVPNMLNARSNFGIEVMDDKLVVVGGFDGITATSVVECFDEKANEWYKAYDLEIPRSALSCCVVTGLPNMAQYAYPRDKMSK